MDERAAKRTQLMHNLLGKAAAEVSGMEGYAEFEQCLHGQEYERALLLLEEMGERAPVSADYWWNLKKAAEVVGLQSHDAKLRRNRLKASRRTE